MEEAVCSHCFETKECLEVGSFWLCEEHSELKQYQPKKQKNYTLKRTELKPKKVYQLKRTPIKPNPNYKMKAKSDKQVLVDLAVESVYKQMASERKPVCTGCGKGKHLSHSHIIPRSRRRDLVSVIENLTYHCMDTAEGRGCHSIWEHDLQARQKLQDYDLNMAFIAEADPTYYELLKAKEEMVALESEVVER